MTGPRDIAAHPHQRGVEAIRSGRLQEAVAWFRRAVELDEDEPAYHSNLGTALHMAGELSLAARAHERAVDLCAQGRLGELASFGPEEQAARRAWYLYNLGSVRAALGQLEPAELAYREALEWVPTFVACLENLATVVQRGGRADEAVTLYRQVLALEPDRVSGHRNLGSALCALGDLTAARAEYRAAVTLAPEAAPVWLDLAAAQQADGALERASESYSRACELAPESAEAHVRRGNVLLAQGRPEAAERAHRRGLELAPESAAAHNALGSSLAAQERHAEAEQHLRQAIGLQSSWPQPYYNLGAMLHHLGRLPEAVDAYRSVLQRAPDHRDAWNNLADALRRLGEQSEAHEAYRRLLELDPDNAAARHLMAALAGETTKAPPADYVQQLFDDYAPRFDRHLIEQLGYRVPELMRAAIDRTADGQDTTGPEAARALDLGCGTGLMGPQLRDLCGLLDGVDLSPGMLALAEKRAIYDQLHLGDVVGFLRDSEREYQLITAAELLIYLGDLQPLFTAVARGLTAGGRFVFTIEEHPGADDEPGYRLRPTGRYAHCRSYIDHLARENGLQRLLVQDIVLRKEHEEPESGLLYVFALAS